MYVRRILIAASVMCADAASAQVSSAWGDEGGCARVNGEVVLTDMVFILTPEGIERHESMCPLIGADRDGEGNTILIAQCSGEGDTWEQSYAIDISDGIMRIWSVDAPDFVTELRPCE